MYVDDDVESNVEADRDGGIELGDVRGVELGRPVAGGHQVIVGRNADAPDPGVVIGLQFRTGVPRPERVPGRAGEPEPPGQVHSRAERRCHRVRITGCGGRFRLVLLPTEQRRQEQERANYQSPQSVQRAVLLMNNQPIISMAHGFPIGKRVIVLKSDGCSGDVGQQRVDNRAGRN